MDFHYRVVRSNKRRTIGIQVKARQVVVRVPCYVSDVDIGKIVEKKSAWIQEKLLQFSYDDVVEDNTLIQGSKIWFAGAPKTLNIAFGINNDVSLNDNTITVTLNNRNKILYSKESKRNQKVRELLNCWYSKQLEQYLESRIPFFVNETGLIPARYKVKKYKARWGSCNSRGELSFNSLLMMTPNWVIDYVIVHELCHLAHMNHSTLFWQLVQTYYPKFGQAKAWLKAHQQYLQL